MLVSSAGFADGKSALKELWHVSYKTDLEISSVHYTINVVVVSENSM